MTVHPLSITIRGKKLGVLLRDARLARGKSLDECAIAIGVSSDALEAYEFGSRFPSLPEVELLAYHLNVPLEHFWGSETLRAQEHPAQHPDPEKLLMLRQRMIGVMIRQARLKAGLEIPLLAEKVNLSPEILEKYEMGELPIPVPELEALAATMETSVRAFEDTHGPVGAWVYQQRTAKSFSELPAELQLFVCKPVNRPYLELAQRLSEMSVEKLRSVAEGLLEITL